MSKFNTQPRELARTDWISESKVTGTVVGTSLEDMDHHKSYDQFANKKSTYNEKMYNTGYNMKDFTRE